MAADEFALVTKTFPTVVPVPETKTIWLSRLMHDDPHLGKSYEIEYGHWIPGDPFIALNALIIFTDNEQQCIDQLQPTLVSSQHWGNDYL